MNNAGIDNKLRGFLLIFYLFSILLISCEPEYTITPFYEGIYKGLDESITDFVVNKADTFSRFRDLMIAGNLDKTLSAFNPHGDNYTLFLPTNEAIDRFVSNNKKYNSFQDLLEDKDYVNELVRYHVVNMALRANDFPYGALPDTCLSGDLLSISYRSQGDTVVPMVNNTASLISFDIELINGFIHIIDEMLEPIVFNNYEWLKQYPEYSIFTLALEKTGLSDTFSVQDNDGKIINPASSLFVEPDIIYNNERIFTIDDLINRFSPDHQDYNSSSNGLYQFVAYHILEGKVFLNNFEGQNANYNTFSNLPVSVNGTGLDIKINAGSKIFDTLITGNDTTFIDYIPINYDLSNVITKNGSIHFIKNVMEQYRPRPRDYTFQFYEDPIIYSASQRPNTYYFEEPEKFEKIHWQGTKYIKYVKLASSSEYNGDDYLEIEGEFSITYEIPKILPGNYMLQIRTNADYYNNAFIQIYLDGKRAGGNINLTTGGSYYTFDVNTVSFTNYEKHQLKIQTLIPGRLTWDCIIFKTI
jgi:uncharacterized surface protein with fasciclin (FAS1) repeats